MCKFTSPREIWNTQVLPLGDSGTLTHRPNGEYEENIKEYLNDPIDRRNHIHIQGFLIHGRIWPHALTEEYVGWVGWQQQPTRSSRR